MMFPLVDGASACAEVTSEREHRFSDFSIATAAFDLCANATEIELAGVI